MSLNEASSRRAVLAAAVGGVAALVADAIGRPMPAAAAAGDPVRAGRSTNAGTYTTGLSTKSTATAFLVVQSGSGHAIRARSTTSPALRGEATAGRGSAIEGIQTGGGTAVGVLGRASAASGDTRGVEGNSTSPDGVGVMGASIAATGPSFGVLGQVVSPDGTGVVGHGGATTGVCVGVAGQTTSPDGWAGNFQSEVGNGIYVSVPVGKAGLNVAAGTKNAVVATDDGARLLYTEEATEVHFSDYGFSRLRGGAVRVSIDPLFAQTVDLSQPYHVFVQGYGVGGFTVERGPTGFRVKALVDADAEAEFSYRVVAKRRGYAADRLERAPWADDDANLGGRQAGYQTTGLGQQRHGGLRRHPSPKQPSRAVLTDG